MKNIKKIFLILIVNVLSIFMFAGTLNVFASDNGFEMYGAAYKVKEIVDEYDLGYGVSFKRELGNTSITKSGLATGIALNDNAPQQVHLLTVKPSENVELVPYTYLEKGNWNAVPVKKAALQYETSHPGYKVIAGVNGDFFKINNSIKASTGVTISQGEFFKAKSNHSSSAINTLAIRNSGEGKQLFTANISKSYPVLSIYNEKDEIIKKIDINKVNEEPDNNEISVYYSQREENFERNLVYEKVNNAWFVEEGIYGVTTIKNSFYGVGVISNFITAETELKVNQFAVKSNNEEINQLLAKDVKIRVQYEYKDPSVEGVGNFIGFPYKLIENGEYVAQEQPTNSNGQYRHPRTMIGQKENGEVVLAVVDGRQTHKDMYGVAAVEMSVILAAEGCVDVWNLDGGGSSTMIVRKQHGWEFNNVNNGFNKDNSSWYITNSPSDGSERSDGNHLLVVVKLPEVTMNIESATETTITLNVCLLTDINKYNKLYVLVNDEYHEVIDGKVTITDLVKDTEYDMFLYSLINNKYVNLMVNKSYSTSKPAPTNIEINVSIFEKNDNEQILFKYTVDKSDAVRKIVFIDKNGKRYLTTSQTIRFEKNEDFYELIHTGKIEITYIANDAFPEEVLILEEFNINYDLMFIFDELSYCSNQNIINIFK